MLNYTFLFLSFNIYHFKWFTFGMSSAVTQCMPVPTRIQNANFASSKVMRYTITIRMDSLHHQNITRHLFETLYREYAVSFLTSIYTYDRTSQGHTTLARHPILIHVNKSHMLYIIIIRLSVFGRVKNDVLSLIRKAVCKWCKGARRPLDSCRERHCEKPLVAQRREPKPTVQKFRLNTRCYCALYAMIKGQSKLLLRI